MERAREQAQRYARLLPPDEVIGGRPPLLIIVDVGASIELYSEFTRTGGLYIPFPDPQNHRFSLDDLNTPERIERLRTAWLDPMALDPALRTARVTREIAARLAALGKSLESAHPAEAVARFLMRCLFTMFAEDVKLLPDKSFTRLLADVLPNPQNFVPMVDHLWQTMDQGGFSVMLRTTIPQFNGELFAGAKPLPVNAAQLQLLIEAAKADWRDVEPAIFGTLLERALNPIERHKLGAHYTPRAYVERLVLPTIIEPLRSEWDSVKIAALLLHEQENGELALGVVHDFHRKLATTTVLDPACGSGNFLYVTMEQMKRLEGEVLGVLRQLGDSQLSLEMESVQVTPQQFLGLEINPRAAAIAELVLWIGFLQWHYRTRGDVQPSQPILRGFHNIECRDAVLAWDGVTPLLDATGQPVTHWDGRTTRPHPVTGEEVPDANARIPVVRYTGARPALWPAADYIVGNPPFIGTARMREALGDGYVEALRGISPRVPDSADYVVYWWDKAAALVRSGAARRFGFITTNSLRQTFNRRVLETHLGGDPPLHLRFAIPDHPWVDAADGAAVRIAMTVADAGTSPGGIRKQVMAEAASGDDAVQVTLSEEIGVISADLTIGADVAGARPLKANQLLTSRGMMLFGSGFIMTADEAKLLGYPEDQTLATVIKHYRNGRDLTARSRGVFVIDLFGLTPDEVRERYPAVYQRVYNYVKPERDQNVDRQIRENWWLHGRPRPELREMLVGLQRYIATVETAKHRFFVFLDQLILPDNMLVAIAIDDAYHLGVLSSRFHVIWALAAGGTLEDRPRYNKTRCFEPFPFPTATPAQQAAIRQLGEQLDAHRKQRQALHPTLTLTDLYNGLDALRSGRALTPKERQIHEQGLVTLLRELHDKLDAAVAAAYGWPVDLAEAEVLEKLVALNRQRAAEEARGDVRWLRPAYQAGRFGAGVEATQPALVESGNDAPSVAVAAAAALAWPAVLPEQARTLRTLLQQAEGPITAAALAARFGKANKARSERITEILETLVSLGQARQEGTEFVER